MFTTENWMYIQFHAYLLKHNFGHECRKHSNVTKDLRTRMQAYDAAGKIELCRKRAYQFSPAQNDPKRGKFLQDLFIVGYISFSNFSSINLF